MRRLICLIITFCFVTALSAQDTTEADVAYQRALELIETAKTENPYCLYLNYKGLTTVPPEIAELTELECVSLSGNELTEVPQVLLDMPNLRTVDLYGNPLNLPSGLEYEDWATIKAYLEDPAAWQFNENIKYAVGFSGLALVYLLAYLVSGKWNKLQGNSASEKAKRG